MPVDNDLDITPMIDVTFLLLIFFMVTSTMQQEATPQIPSAKHGQGISTDEAIVITVTATEDQPKIYLSDRIGEQSADLEEIGPYVDAELKSGKKILVIKADRDLPSGFVEEITQTANSVKGIEKFFVGIQDKAE